MADGLDNLIRLFGRIDASGRAGVMDDEVNASKLAFAELGTVTAPARPTVTPAFGKVAEANLGAALGRAVDAAARGVVSIDGQDIVGGVVEEVAEKIRANIDSNTPPPLAAATIASRQRRGNSSTATLVDTGDMRAAVRSETRRGSEGWPE